MDYLISDIHFGHLNALSFDKRPFKTLEEQDQYIIKHWNERITDDDNVWILGDVSWIGITPTIEFYKQLKGRLHLITGNHDEKYIRSGNFRSLFTSINDYKEIQIEDTNLVLSHFPLLSYKNSRHNWIHLYGHVHISREWTLMEQLKAKMKMLYYFKNNTPVEQTFNTYNVGCMCPYMQYIPRTLDEIINGYEKCKQENTLNLQHLPYDFEN